MAKKSKIERAQIRYRPPKWLHDDLEALAAATDRSLNRTMIDLHVAARQAKMTGLVAPSPYSSEVKHELADDFNARR